MTTIVFLGKHEVGETVYRWLCNQDDADVLAMITEKEQLPVVKELDPDLVVSGGFNYIVPDEIIDIPQLGVVNMHGSYLPYNRGSNPNVWPLIDGSPAGVSLHYMTSELDGGPIIAREKIEKKPNDTSKSLLSRIEDAAVQQFIDSWPDIRDGTTDVINQKKDDGSYHTQSEFVDLWEIDLAETATYGEVIDHLRALTFPPYKNAHFEKGGEQYFVEISISPVKEVSSNIDEYAGHSETQ